MDNPAIIDREALEAILAQAAERAAAPYVSVATAAALIDSSEDLVRDQLSAGKLTKFRIGGKLLIHRAELEALIRSSASHRPRKGRGKRSD